MQVALVLIRLSVLMEYMQAVEKFRKMMNDMKLINPFAIARTAEWNLLSSSVNPVRLKNNPIELDTPTIRSLYKIIVKQ